MSGAIASTWPVGSAVAGRSSSSTAWAAHLRDRGIGPGSIVLIQSRQHADLSSLLAATWALGAIFAPIDESWPAYLTARVAERLRPEVVVGAEPQLAALQSLFPAAAVVELGADLMAAEDVDESQVAVDEAAAFLFTSGSTGVPKAVVHSRRGLLAGARVTLDTFGWQPGERLVNLPEPHTMSGLRNALVAAPLGRLEWLPVPREAAANIVSLCDWLGEAQPDRLVCGPALLRHLVLMERRLPDGIFARLKAIYSTGATLNASAAASFHAHHGVPVVNYYGLTETGGICLSQRPDDHVPGDDSLGRPVGCEVRLVGGDTPDRGELQVRSHQLMVGYLNDPARTAARFDGDWLRTGDVMTRDASGAYRLVGRSDLFIKSATTDRIHPEEIEVVLEDHPLVTEAAVSGVATPTNSDQVVALVAMSEGQGDGMMAVQLAKFVEERLGRARTPDRILFVDALPRLPGGKIDRVALAGMAS